MVCEWSAVFFLKKSFSSIYIYRYIHKKMFSFLTQRRKKITVCESEILLKGFIKLGPNQKSGISLKPTQDPPLDEILMRKQREKDMA